LNPALIFNASFQRKLESTLCFLARHPAAAEGPFNCGAGHPAL